MEACEYVQGVFLIPEATRMFNRRSGFQRHADFMHAQTSAVWKEILIINHIADASSLSKSSVSKSVKVGLTGIVSVCFKAWVRLRRP